MTANVLLYRLWRLRRLIAVAILPPLAVTALWLPPGQVMAGLFIALSVLVPLAHVLTYPKDYAETMTVSLVLAFTLWLASGIDPTASVLATAMRAVGLAALAFVLFLVAIIPMGTILALGPMRESGHVRASRRSRLSPAELKPAITLYPGREDARTTCGPANAEGVFEVETRHEVAPMAQGCAVDADGAAEAPGIMTVRFFGSVVSTGEDHHEIISFEEPDGAIEASRHTFEATAKGSRVTVEETTAGLTGGMALGFWLQDYLADHLTDEIDAAEGRTPRANRAFPQTSLFIDTLGWISRRLGRRNDPQADGT